MSSLDALQIMRKAYDNSTGELKTQSVGAASGDVGSSKLTAEQIIRKCYDEATGKLRTVGDQNEY